MEIIPRPWLFFKKVSLFIIRKKIESAIYRLVPNTYLRNVA